jgi:hypothetical protein
LAKAWYQLTMVGTQGIFSKTYVTYQGSRVLLNDAMATWFEHFSSQVPLLFAAYLMPDTQTWVDKFKLLLPFPWYEFFVITAPPDFYPAATGGKTFTSSGLGPDVKATPTVVGRINPTPTITADASNNTAPKFTGIELTRWQNLTLFTLEGYQPIDVVIGFDEQAVANFFTLNPTYMGATIGQSNSALSPYIFSFYSAGDRASIERYGFRPVNGSTHWLADTSGQIAVQGDANDPQLLADLLSRLCATYAPGGLMARGRVTTFLRPDIMPGCRFRFQPFKNGTSWDFYVDAVEHSFVFGKRALTTLILSRGLPPSVYGDDGLLYNTHIGNVQRVNGVYVKGLPSGSDSALQPIGPGAQQQFFAGLERVYKTAQGTNASP